MLLTLPVSARHGLVMVTAGWALAAWPGLDTCFPSFSVDLLFPGCPISLAKLVEAFCLIIPCSKHTHTPQPSPAPR